MKFDKEYLKTTEAWIMFAKRKTKPTSVFRLYFVLLLVVEVVGDLGWGLGWGIQVWSCPAKLLLSSCRLRGLFGWKENLQLILHTKQAL